MKPLPIEFIKWGDRFSQIKRNTIAAMYQRTTPLGHMAFEVWVITRQKAGTVFGRDVPERELPPPTSSFGTRGWSYLDTPKGRAKAEAKYQSVSAEKSRRSDPGRSPSEDAATPQSADVSAKKDDVGTSVKMTSVSQEGIQEQPGRSARWKGRKKP